MGRLPLTAVDAGIMAASTCQLDLEAMLDAAVEQAEVAGQILLKGYSLPTGVETKDDGTFVSDQDKAASASIGSALKSLFPDVAILDEETVEDGERFTKEACWVVDPLDGTREYLAKTGDFSVMIGLMWNYQPVLGVVHRPLLGETVYAVKGRGVFVKTGEQVVSMKNNNEQESRKVLISRSRKPISLTKSIDRLRWEDGAPAEIVEMGGSVKTIEVARGRANLFMCPPESVMSLWDVCACQVILEESGGVLSDVNGKPIDYASKEPKMPNGVLACCSPMVHRIALGAWS